MPAWASRLIAAERSQVAGDTEARAGLRACEKLRRPLSTLAGVAGFRSLLTRAWVLAKGDAPWLTGLQIKPDGSFLLSPEMESTLASDEADQATTALVHQLLQLLITFIGEALTLRLMQDVWPKAALEEVTPDDSPYEKKS
jgi:hypothetical protein